MRGATLIRRGSGVVKDISIHAPHAGRDLAGLASGRYAMTFQSTRPMRGATVEICGVDIHLAISIHAPHAGRDVHPCDVA